MAVIRIKRGTGTTAPSSLKTAEIGYAMGTGTQANGGDRLYFGKGDDGSGNATSVVVVGGEYFANMLDHVAGTLTASSAIITDASSKIDVLNVDNVTLDGNTISTTNSNGSLVLDPNGSGKVLMSQSVVGGVSTPVLDSDAANKAYVDTQVAANNDIDIAGDTGTDNIEVASETLTFTGGTALTTVVTSNTVTTNLDNTAVTPNTYGSGSAIPNFTVDAQGRITNAGTTAISSTLDLAADGGTDNGVLIGTDTLTVAGGKGIVTAVSGDTITVNIDSAEFLGQYNSSIVHDTLTGFVANEHIDHTSVSITAGVGLKGGGTIASTRDLAIDSAELIASYNSSLVHDDLSGFVANEHIDHSAVSVIAGSGLTGGGTIAANRTLNVIGGDGITANADEIEVTVDDSTIELSASSGSGAIRVKDGGVTNAKLANDSITIGSTEIDLGATSTVLAGLTQIDVDNIRIVDNTVASTTGVLTLDPNPIDSDGGDVIVRGNFTVQGITTTVNSTTVSINDLNMVLADSAANAAGADGAGLTIGGAGYSGTKATFTYNGGNDEWEVNKTLNISSGSLEIGGVDYLELIDDHLSGSLFAAGEGIDLAYNDGAGTLTVSAELATISNPGVASFDSDEFTVSSGAVVLDTVDGGTF
jgi:hypothetical protein